MAHYLKSMTDFIFEQHEQCISQNGRTYNYAKFLKRQPTKGDFVPCDLDGNVLEKPRKDDYSFYADRNMSVQEEYQQAKERVLFKGVKSAFGSDGRIWVSMKKGLEFGICESETIEDLICFNLEITDNAAKMLGYE